MEKIEKLEGSYDVPQLKQKLNKIIDYLNSQDQEEEIIIRGEPMDLIKDTPEEEETLVESVERKYNINLGVDKETNLEELLKQKGLPAMSNTLEDTPEEWEKEFELPGEIEHEDCIEVLADKHKLWEICSWEEPELDPDKVVAFIKQLLEERECRAREEGMFDGFELSYIKTLHSEARAYRKYMGVTLTEEGEKRDKDFISKLSKLTTK